MIVHWVGQRKTETGHITLVCGVGEKIRREIPTPFRSSIPQEVVAQILRDNPERAHEA